MKKWHELSFSDQLLANNRAEVWFQEHTDHVQRVLADNAGAYPPSGRDCLRPERWKAEHWRWYLQRGKEN